MHFVYIKHAALIYTMRQHVQQIKLKTLQQITTRMQLQLGHKVTINLNVSAINHQR